MREERRCENATEQGGWRKDEGNKDRGRVRDEGRKEKGSMVRVRWGI